jgi:hypothetical protein
MTAEQVIAKMKELYGENIADPEVFPRQFQHQVKMAARDVAMEEALKNNQSST